VIKLQKNQKIQALDDDLLGSVLGGCMDPNFAKAQAENAFANSGNPLNPAAAPQTHVGDGFTPQIPKGTV
jgi:hypothetical protein